MAFNNNIWFNKDNNLNATFNKTYKEKNITINQNKFKNFSKFINEVEINNKSSVNYGYKWDRNCHEQLYIFSEKLRNKGVKL